MRFSSQHRVSWGMAVLGTAALIVAVATSSTQIEAVLGRAPGALSWGPALFRALLAFHGCVALWTAWFGSRTQTIAVPRQKNALEAWPRYTWLWLSLLCVAGLALRLWQLNTSLWLDEVLTAVNYVRAPFGEILSKFPDQNQHLLNSLAAHLSVSIFGESAAAIRLPAVLFGVASIPALYILGRRVVGHRTAMAAAALMTFSYHHVWFSQNARGYSGLLLAAIVSTYFWLRAVEQGERKDWIGYTLATVFGFGVHLTMVFVTSAQFLLYLVMIIRDPEHRAARLRQGMWSYILAGTLTLQLFALLLPELLTSGLQEVSLESKWTNPLFLLTSTVANLGAGTLGLAVLAVALGVSAVGLIAIARRDRLAAFAFTLPILVAATVTLTSGHNLWPRVFYFAMGFLLLIGLEGGLVITAALASRLLPQRFESFAQVAAATLVVLLSAATVPQNYRYPKQDFTGARDYVEQNREPGDPVVAVGLASFVYKDYYAPEWDVAEDAETLKELQQRAPSPWLIYTLPIQVETYRPDIWEIIQAEYEPVKIFPGTLQGGGEIYVCRRVTVGQPTLAQGGQDAETR